MSGPHRDVAAWGVWLACLLACFLCFWYKWGNAVVKNQQRLMYLVEGVRGGISAQTPRGVPCMLVERG